MSVKQFTLYWLDGKHQVVTGETIEQAFTTAGYGAGALKAVDFYIDGDNHEYDWNKEQRSWVRKEPIITVTPKPTDDEAAKLAQGYSWNVELSVKPPEEHPGKYKLFVSHNLGANYSCEYSTEDKTDPELMRRMKQAKKKALRFYVEGDDSVMCPQHENIIHALGGGVTQTRTIEQQADLLRGKFGK
jgi:hypothetical protein